MSRPGRSLVNEAAGSDSKVRTNSDESVRVDQNERGGRITAASHSQRQVEAHAADAAIEP